MPSRSAPKLLLFATAALMISALAAAWPVPQPDRPAMQGNQLGPGWMCVTAPSQIEHGSTEPIEVNLELSETPSGDDATQICQPVEIYEVMGVGIAGIALDNFQIDPPDTRIDDRIDPTQVNNFTWVVNAVGPEGSRHNLIVYAYIADAERSTGFRSIARIPLRITIEAPPKTIWQEVLAFLNSIKEILIVAGGVITVLIALRGQVRKLRGARAEDVKPDGS